MAVATATVRVQEWVGIQAGKQPVPDGGGRN